MNFFKKKTILITGGTGSFGRECVKALLNKHKDIKIIIFSRDEWKQQQMEKDFINFKKRLRFFLGDVRDYPRLKLAFQKTDIVIHAAALKQVPAAEYNPFEFIKTNIMGTQNVIDAALNTNVERAILLSTDKAAAPVNLYGATKLAADKVFIAANNYTGSSNKKFSVVRYGNVMMSRGSFIPILMDQIKNKQDIQITDKRMTRFSITLHEATNFVLDCLTNMWGGELFIPKIPSYRIMDVVAAISPKSRIKIIGLRPGEKLHEEMITQSDSFNTVEFNKHYVILPSKLKWDVKKFLNKNKKNLGKNCKEFFSYNSLDNKSFLSINQIKKQTT
jgi:UDP-N-acetylglucosamine 4,6-dehydratase (inverting)